MAESVEIKGKNSMKQVLITMPIWMHERVKKEAKLRDSSSVSSIIREALDAYLNNESNPHGWDFSFSDDTIIDDIF